MRLQISVTLTAVVMLAASASADERHIEFIRRLQDRGYHDLVVEYVESMRNRADVPEDVRATADFWIAKSLLAGAEAVSELAQRDEQLQLARSRFERFIQQNPGHDRVAEAQMDQAQILIERGRVAVLESESPRNESRREEFRLKARDLFDAARQSFGEARGRFEADFKRFPAFIPEEQKRQREAKAASQVNLMQAQLQIGLVEYESAQTFDKASSDYTKTLEQAVAIFEVVRTQYRVLLGGLYARMWQGKCFEEMGQLGKAEGIYKELMEHEQKEPAMQALHRQVQFFQIIVLNKRGDHILAADLARRWLQDNPSMRRSEAGLGVQFEQAKGLIQQSSNLPAKNPERNRLLGQAMEALAVVARYDTIYKQPAIVLQQKYKGMIGAAGAALTFDKALALGDEAKDRGAWQEAGELYTQALRQARDNLDSDQLALLRYKLSFAHFQTKRYYESAVLGEFVARQQYLSSYAAPAAHVALEAYARAFNDAVKLGQSAEFEQSHITDLVAFVTETWPKAPEANAARLLLGDLHLHHGQFLEAARSFESVTANSPDYGRAIGRAGDAYWQVYVEGATRPVEQRDAAGMADALAKARENLGRSVAEQRKQLKPDAPRPRELAELEVSLADASIESGQPDDAIQLMKELVPIAQKQPELKPVELRALIALLRGCIAARNLGEAEKTMKAIEATGKDLAQITRVYLDLGRQLQAEMERIKALNDQAKYNRTRASYVAFLDQMAARREGQSFLTLQWTGEAFFGLDMFDKAAERFGEIVRRTLADPKFLDLSKPENRSALLQTKLRYVTTLRKQARLNEAWEEIKPLPPEANTAKDPMHVGPTTNLDIIMERGLVLEEWGASDAGRLKTAIDHWAYWGQQLEKLTPRPAAYWEVRLHLVRCLLQRARKPLDANDRQQRLKQAEQQMLLLTRTSTTLGGPPLRAQFKQAQQELEKELGRPIGGAAPASARKSSGT